MEGKFEFNTCLPTKEEQSLLNVSKNTPLLLTSDWHYKLGSRFFARFFAGCGKTGAVIYGHKISRCIHKGADSLSPYKNTVIHQLPHGSPQGYSADMEQLH